MKQIHCDAATRIIEICETTIIKICFSRLTFCRDNGPSCAKRFFLCNEENKNPVIGMLETKLDAGTVKQSMKDANTQIIETAIRVTSLYLYQTSNLIGADMEDISVCDVPIGIKDNELTTPSPPRRAKRSRMP
nr:unnamed protein product [Callosobruchus chinensis]